MGDNYLKWLLYVHDNAHGNADIIAYFFRRMFNIVRSQGTLGLIATNTISQGDTRTTGLAAILHRGGSILRAVKRIKWPGEAAVVVSVVHILRGKAETCMLDNRLVPRISAYLLDNNFDDSPALLAENARIAFAGTKIYGSGFVFESDANSRSDASSFSEMQELISNNPNNARRIIPYIGGEDLNTNPRPCHTRYVIDFGDFSEDIIRREWPDLVAIVEPRLKASRGTYTSVPWWQFERRRPELYAKIAKLDRVLAIGQISGHLALTFVTTAYVFDQSIIVITLNDGPSFALLQSRVHELWVRTFSSTLKTDLRYNPTECFQTFPFLRGFQANADLKATGEPYHDQRAALMVGRNEGMTKAYNRFHDRREAADDIVRLRELHAEMDRAVLRAYCWDDLAKRAEPQFLDETNEDDQKYQGRLFWPAEFRDEVLARLLALNAERAAAERENEPLAPRPRAKRTSRDLAETALLQRVAADEDD